ncbi:CD225/dispanin family protein [Gordonia sp. HY002]|uniref:CD225/dispanin family protein n=1 Tax=Gordonia zhenghanii TaxID=2911516 RepID=UPI001EF11F98|nr:CD225/dispanin family protein [Gordonia zhenghanii]MCF8568933.1 CD225/dispanin family protein [Gordonia zhenghanii]MCF8603028.1 CD225/dispanin family protein [Gordonia zhenghanii]
MTTPENPYGSQSDDSEWAAYEPTQVGVPKPDPGFQYAPPPLPPAPAPVPYGTPYPYPGQQFGARPPAGPPQTGQISSVVAMVLGGILTLSCYGTLVGIAPLVLGIVGFTKANSVGRLWYAGRTTEAAQAAESSKKAAMWAWISMGIGVVLAVIVIVLIIAWAINTDSTPDPTYTYTYEVPA